MISHNSGSKIRKLKSLLVCPSSPISNNLFFTFCTMIKLGKWSKIVSNILPLTTVSI